jgi:uncharacterized protein
MTNYTKQKKKITILSLDGGGIRGIISCAILQYIEQQLQQQDHPEAKLGNYFDLIAGSSTGGIITSVLLFPNENKTAKYSINKALDLYTNNGVDIFSVNFWQQLLNPFGLLNEKISELALEKYLSSFFGNLELKHMIKPCVITAYDIQHRCVKIFNSTDGIIPLDNFYVKDICRATTAAPTYFEPVQITSQYGQKFSLIDGGVYANNPALCAFAEAKKIPFGTVLEDSNKPNYPDVNDLIIVSLSTGVRNIAYPYKSLKNAGKLKWVTPLIDMLLSANAEAVDYQLKQMFNSLGIVNRRNYYRLNPKLEEAASAMDNVSTSNIEALLQDGLLYIEQNKKTLDQIVKKLIKNKSTTF